MDTALRSTYCFVQPAAARDGRVIGVILSGMRDDGAAGLAVIKAGGGATIVQDPEEALYGGMPASALAHVAVDAVVPSERIAGVVTEMVNRSTDPTPTGPHSPGGPGDNPGTPSDAVTTVCPECGEC